MKKYYPSREACAILGLHPNTLRKYANEGKIVHYKTESGQRRYDVDSYLGQSLPATTLCYCRVSSYKQKEDLERQTRHMRERFPEAEIVKDIGSGLNFKRKGLLAILERAMQGEQLTVVAAHRDRIARFGLDLIRHVIERSGGKLLVLDNTTHSPEAELVNDLLSILHVFSCRMHGLRSYKSQIRKAFSNTEPEEEVQALD